MRNRLSYMHLPVVFLPSPSSVLTACDTMSNLMMDLSRMPQLKPHISLLVSWTFGRTHLEKEVIVFASLTGAKQ